jgi:hypothetical protein
MAVHSASFLLLQLLLPCSPSLRTCTLLGNELLPPAAAASGPPGIPGTACSQHSLQSGSANETRTAVERTQAMAFKHPPAAAATAAVALHCLQVYA